MDRHYVICVKNEGYAASLELRKLYEWISDSVAQNRHQIRVVDESGDDYLYPDDFFVEIQISKSVEETLSRAA